MGLKGCPRVCGQGLHTSVTNGLLPRFFCDEGFHGFRVWGLEFRLAGLIGLWGAGGVRSPEGRAIMAHAWGFLGGLGHEGFPTPKNAQNGSSPQLNPKP